MINVSLLATAVSTRQHFFRFSAFGFAPDYVLESEQEIVVGLGAMIWIVDSRR